jgi:hypothetical protein
MVSSILNNFMTNLSPMQVGAFNPIIDNRYGDFASAQNEKQRQQDKVRQMIEQAEAEGRPLSQSEASLASMLEPNAVSGYNNNLTTQSNLRTNEINQQQEISELENEEILKIANKLESTDDPLMKKVYYEQFKRRATQAGFFDETDPQEYSEEAENTLIGYRDKVLEQAKDARSYGNAGGATGALLDRLKKEHPEMDDTQILYMIQTGFRQGKTITKDGRILNLDGTLFSMQEQKEAEATGTGLGKEKIRGTLGMENLETEQNIINEGEVNTTQRTSDIETENTIKEKDQIQKNESIVKAQEALPTIENNVVSTIGVMDSIRSHPALERTTGVLDSTLPTFTQDVADLEELNNELTGVAYEQALDSLRGLGSASNLDASSTARAKLNGALRQGKRAYLEALDRFEERIANALNVAEKKAGGDVYNRQPQTQTQQSNQSDGFKILSIE